MSLPRLLLRLLLGRRLPVVDGERTVTGLTGPVTIRHDRWGIPSIEAGTDTDAAFALGFCHGQDRGFQLELLVRLGRGTLAELVGSKALPADRLSRRIGFRRAAEVQVGVLDADIRGLLSAYTAGVNAGRTVGSTKPPHELVFVGGRLTPWDIADVLAFSKVQAFLLPSNWDVELARLRLLRADGAAALAAVDPSYTPESPPTNVGGKAFDALSNDLKAFHQFAPPGGGSNNWVVAGSRTRSGKPVLAGDPHLGPTVPSPWYLAHVRTPEWAVAGATFAGAPLFPIGHNGFACWSVTAGLTDNSDVVIESPDAVASATVVRETIRVKGQPDVVEEVRVTANGPILTPILDGVAEAVSLRAVWLHALPMRGFFDSPRARSFDQFRRPFAHWPTLPLNVLYADETGTVGYQLVGQLPVRDGGNGTLPLTASACRWTGYVPFEQMPTVVDPPAGFLATANATPPGETTAFLGVDFVDPYRRDRIAEVLASRTGWDVVACLDLQRDQHSLPWRELKPHVEKLSPTDPDAVEARTLLLAWDGVMTAESSAAAVFALTVADLCVRVAKKLAPNGWQIALGGDPDNPSPSARNLFADCRVGHLLRLLGEQPTGWTAEIEAALGETVRTLRSKHGPAPAFWQWGDIRPLVLGHPLFEKVPGLKAVFNLGPVPLGGDENTVLQAAVLPLAPTKTPHNLPNLRAAFDTADWSACRFVLAGGQSGNPASPHYADQFELWQKGDAVPIACDRDAVLRSAVSSLRLTPTGGVR